MAWSALNPASVLVLPNSGLFVSPFALASNRPVSSPPTSMIVTPNRSGRSVIAGPIIGPAALSACPDKCAGEVYFLSIRYSAQAMKSRQEFGLVGPFPARCHSSPYSPPPRTWQTACTPPLSYQARKNGSEDGFCDMP